MTPFEHHPPPVDRYAWVPPALSSGLTLAIGIMLAIAWQRFLGISGRLGIEAGGRSMFSVAMALIEAFLLWRVWTQGRKAIGLWRAGQK